MRMNPFGWRQENDTCYEALLASSICDDFDDISFGRGAQSVELLSDDEIEDLLQDAA